MTDKSGKAKKGKKSAKAQPSVLGSLPATRPDRLGRRSTATAARSKSAATPAKRAAKPKPARKAAPKPVASKPAAARPATPPPPPPPPPPDDRARRPAGPPSGPQLVTTAIQAAGELAQIGLTVGGQVLRRATRRFPRP